MANDLIEEVGEKYCQLRSLCRDHELLRYFVQDEGEFRLNPDISIKVEFLTRFNELKKEEEEKMTEFKQYQQRLASSVFGNYLNALEEAISKNISKN